MATFLLCIANGRGPEDPLLWENTTEFLHQTKFNKHFAKALKEAKVRRVRVHDLRHSLAVHFLERGGQLYALQKLLGHYSIRLTERYSHFSVAMAELSRGVVDHHGEPKPFTVVDGGVRSEMSQICPRIAKMAVENASVSVESSESNFLN